jgi:tetratricopeptide (TPR) repeat protein
MQGKPQEAMPYVRLAQDAPFTNDRDLPFGQGLVTLVGGLVLLGKGDVAELIVERAARAAAGNATPDPVFEAFLISARCALTSVAPLGDKWHLEESFHEGRNAVALLRRLGAVHGESVALYYFAVAAMHLGRYEEAREASQRSAELTRRASSGVNDGWPRLFLGKALLRLGRPEDALAAVAELAASPDRTVRHMLPVIVAEARLRQGNFAAAEADAAPACAGMSPRLRRLAACILAHAQLKLERPADALSTIEEALEQPTTNGLESDIDLLTLRAEALFVTGRTAEAAEAIVSASNFVLAVAADIGDEALKASFLNNVEPCARALSLKARWAPESV